MTTEEILASLLFGLIITWIIGLTPPIIIRFVILKRPLKRNAAIGICAGLWVFNLILFFALGSKSKTHGALVLIALASYYILTKKGKAEQSHSFSRP